MKKWPLVLVSIAVFTAVTVLTGFTDRAESNSNKYLVMRVYENFTVTSSKIIINYPDSTFEVIPLEPFKYNDDYLVRNGKVLTRTLNKLSEKGYRIVTSVADGQPTSSRNMMITTFVMESHP